MKVHVRRLRSWWYWPPAGSAGRTILPPVLVLITGVLVLGALMIRSDWNYQRHRIISAAGDDAAQAAYEVEQLLGSRLGVLSAVAASPSFRNNDLDAGRRYLRALDAAALGFDGLIYFVDTEGMIQASTNSPGLRTQPELPIDITARPYWRPPLESGTPYVGAAFMGVLSPPRPLVPLLVPVRNWDGTVIGLIGGTLLLEPFSQDITFGPGIGATVVDREGQQIVQNGVATFPKDVSREPLFAELRTAGSGTLVDVTGLDQQPGQLIGFATTVEPAGWTIVTSQSLRAALGPVISEVSLEFGALLGGLAVALAITSRVVGALDRAEAAERALLAGEHSAREAAEATLLEREREIGEVCHDLRSPLSAIYGCAVYLRRRVERAQPVDPPLVQEFAGEIETSAKRLDAMIQDLLDAAQLQAGHALILNRGPGDLLEILRQVVAEQQRSTARTIRVDAEGSIHGEWDSLRMRRVFGNLLSNAVKFSPEGGEISVSANLETDHAGRSAVIRVRDSGIGIPAQDLPYIFERFSRAKNAVGIAGTGLGLAATRHLVELHGGTIEAESQEHKGSTFVVRVPVTDVDQPGVAEAREFVSAHSNRLPG